MIPAYAPLLIPLAPLLAALTVGLLEGLIGRRAYSIATFAQVVGIGVSFFTLYAVGATGAAPIQIPLFVSGSLFSFGLYIDRLAAVMMALISVIGFLVFLFSVRYMQQDSGQARFHALLSLSTFVLLCMVASQNLLMLFVFWQLLSFLIYLLSHNYSHRQTVSSAFRAYTLFRIGDVAFLLGIVILYHLYGTLNWETLFHRAAEAPYTFFLLPGGFISMDAATVITLLIFIGAMSKSVQFPMNLWLPGALYAPTPVHALQHAGMINAGGFLLNRLAPLYVQSSTTLHIVFAVGLLTTLLGASMMLTQNDIKKTLGHSTIAQMGYMIMECGLGAFALAIFHLVAHGFFKATIFLNCGDVIHAARREPRYPPLLPNLKKPPTGEREFSRLTWGVGFVMTLILPLIILLAAHGVLNNPLIDSQGAVILLFFAWVTSSQAILTLNRLQVIGSWKATAAMFLTLLGVVGTYLFAAERFTHFLYPNKAHVAFFFRAAALPGFLFDLIVSATASAIIAGWVIIYAKAHQQPFKTHEWINRFLIRLYVLLLKRLYLEDFYGRLGRKISTGIDWLDKNLLFQIGIHLAGFFILLGMLLPAMMQASDFTITHLLLFSVAILFLPLFPLHGVYLMALTRCKGVPRTLLVFLMPMLGGLAVSGLSPNVSAAIQPALILLALLSALYSAFTAWVQIEVTRRLAYGGIAFSAILWWYFAHTGGVTQQAVVYISAMVLTTSGLFLGLQVVVARLGDTDHIGGLAQSMPRFAFVFSLLVMAAMGLPPFGLFSALIEMLLHHTIRISWELWVIGLTWLMGSWCFLDLMQGLLFGSLHTNIPHRDLSRTEGALLAGVLILLLVLGMAPYGFVVKS